MDYSISVKILVVVKKVSLIILLLILDNGLKNCFKVLEKNWNRKKFEEYDFCKKEICSR